MYKEISACRCCNSKNLKLIFDLGNQYLTGVFPKNKNDYVESGPVQLVKCMGECGLVQLKQSYSPEDMYRYNYGYRSGLNKSMVNHLKNIVDKINSIINLKEKDTVLDIGSNDSTTLQFYDKKLNLIGIDPTGVKFAKYYPEHIKLIPEFFNSKLFLEKTNGEKAKVITSIAMFYDLEDPNMFMQEIFKCLDDNGLWVFEQSYLPAMLEENAYDTICHEHLSYFAFKQIKYMLDKNNFKIIDIDLNDCNGGSFKLTVSKNNSNFSENVEKIKIIEKYEIIKKIEDIKTYEDFVSRINNNKNQILNFLKECENNKKTVYGYGASTKGNVLIQYCELNQKNIKEICEVNEDKYGCYTPGSLIRIDSEENIKQKNPDYLIVFPWHFKESIIKKENKFIKDGGKLVFPLPNFHIYE